MIECIFRTFKDSLESHNYFTYYEPLGNSNTAAEEARVKEMLSSFVNSMNRWSCIGWNADWNQGQFEIDKDSLKSNYWSNFRDRDTWTISCSRQEQWGNQLAVIPGLNVIVGIISIARALFSGGRPGIKAEDVLKYRLLTFVVGVAEITWIGGIALHGIASIYFAHTRASQAQANPTAALN